MGLQNCIVDGLPFFLNYGVWHHKSAGANEMFDNKVSLENSD